ncbi:MAG TPA: membrane or secreted protein [Hymenobacter sp.]|uniref:membrane or secreted protein n=1 Tax=Hymenobacter sp. TaxID=1898978 RepID=UPI002D7FA8C0|nr:membrane or secreted protein [Hymenobacter sp.]HET9506255.1 membrane or secreted protein [Hymenobacter sp.]
MSFFSFLRASLSVAALAASLPTRAQVPPTPTGDVFVDAKGVLRWQKTKQEVSLFGVNYTAPFAYSYRALLKQGIKPEDAIDQDVYHLARLGVDAFRVHVWDVEITDTLGNLQQNEHLRLLDYLITKLQARNIKIILTPIAYWGNAYPEPTNTGRGFSSIYDKGQAYTNPRAVRAQENYLGQFLQHRNQYSGRLYREDPGIIAYEVCNEPHYRPPLAPVLSFANRLVAAMRATGLKKPIFYNIAESPQVKDAILDANVQGVSFQWYPEGLVAGHELKGNFLPYVDQYPLPYKGDKRFDTKAKMVYEFESADVLQPIMYPFMAKSFREAGFQWATQFAYDPLGIAAFNTEYQTHYLNLAYTPAKALSLLIAGRVFHEVKRGQSFGRYPADTVFGAARVSYRQQLSEWNAPAEFYYTANTGSRPMQPARLRHVAGVGSSEVVQYGGSGAYFLDQVSPGTWRLEVMPDAQPESDSFATPALNKVVTRITWNAQPLTVALPDLGPAFLLRGLSKGNQAQATASGGQVAVRPGTYLLTKATDARAWPAQKTLGVIGLEEFVAPNPTFELPLNVRHQPAPQATAGQPLSITLTGSGSAFNQADSLLLVAQHYYGPTRTLPMRRTGGGSATATVPAALTYPGLLRYWLVLKQRSGETVTLPGPVPGTPRDWDFTGSATAWEVPLVAATAPLPLFTAARDRDAVEAKGISWTDWTDFTTTPGGALALRLLVNPAKAGQPAPSPASALRAYLGAKTATRTADLAGFKDLVIKAASNQPANTRLRVALVSRDAVAYEAVVPLPAPGTAARVPLSALRPAPLLLVPRPYPGFLPLTHGPASAPPFRLADMEVLQVIVDQPAALGEQLRVDIESVTLE